jgi:hypothetical protein
MTTNPQNVLDAVYQISEQWSTFLATYSSLRIARIFKCRRSLPWPEHIVRMRERRKARGVSANNFVGYFLLFGYKISKRFLNCFHLHIQINKIFPTCFLLPETEEDSGFETPYFWPTYWTCPKKIRPRHNWITYTNLRNKQLQIAKRRTKENYEKD